MYLGCKSFGFKDKCTNFNSSVAIGVPTPCYVNGRLVKKAGTFSIHQAPMVVKTVPEVINITATTGRSNASAVVTMVGYPPGGQTYCVATPTSIRNTISNFNALIAIPNVQIHSFVLFNESSVLKQRLTLIDLVPVLSYDIMCPLVRHYVSSLTTLCVLSRILSAILDSSKPFWTPSSM